MCRKRPPTASCPKLLKYEQCLGHREGPYTFCSLVLEDLHSGHKEYLGDIQQLLDALPRSLYPGSRLTLKAQVTPPGQVCLISCEPHYGGSCPQMGSSRARQVELCIIWHARDAVWSCEGVILRYLSIRVTSTGSTIQRRLRLAAPLCIPVILTSPFPVIDVKMRCPPLLLTAHYQLLPQFLPRNLG